MKLNDSFNQSFEESINSYAPLENWFERNQEEMAYFGLTSKDCTQYENTKANQDLIVLGRMANAAFTWLEMPEYVMVTPEEKALYASMAMEKVYVRDFDSLSYNAMERYYINTNIKEKENIDGYSYKKTKGR